MEVKYGADKDGLICGYLFMPGQTGVSVDLDRALQWLDEHDGLRDGFVWLHFNLSDTPAEGTLRRRLPMVPEFFDALREGSRSTRIEDASDTLVAVVNDVAYEFAFDASEIATLWVQVSPGLAITARTHPLKSIDRLRQAVRDGLPFGSSVDFLNRLMRDQGDVLVRIVRAATLQVDDIEDSLLAGRLRSKRLDLGKLRRVLVRLQRLLAPEPGALFRLLRRPPPWVPADDADGLRQATEEFTLVLRDVAELQERIKLLQEEIAAQLGEQTNRSLFTLTVVTVLALPINIVAGLFGMNVGGIPLAEDAHGFAFIVGLILAFTVLAAWWVFFRERD